MRCFKSRRDTLLDTLAVRDANKLNTLSTVFFCKTELDSVRLALRAIQKLETVALQSYATECSSEAGYVVPVRQGDDSCLCAGEPETALQCAYANVSTMRAWSTFALGICSQPALDDHGCERSAFACSC